VLLGIKLLDHLRYVLALSRWPVMSAMASGWIPLSYVQRFHPGWYARLTADASAPVPEEERLSPPAASPTSVSHAGGGA